jgi:hypothetical protein
MRLLFHRLLAQLFCGSPQPGAKTPLGSRLWWLLLLAVGLAKMWSVAGDEVLTQESDASSYAWSTLGWVWGRTEDFLPTHPSGMPLIAGIFAQLGIPWRLALEVLYLAACGGLAAVLANLVRSRLVGALVFIVMSWHPWTFCGFHDFMTDPFMLPLSVALLACLLRVLGQPSHQWRWPAFLVIGGLLFLWAWSRYEEPLLYGTYLLFAVIAWVLTQKESQPAARVRRLAMLALPLLMAVLLATTAKTINYYHFGIAAKAQIGGPGLMTLFKTLYRIKPDHDLLYAPVTRQSLQAACQVSPTLQTYEKSLLDPQAPATRFGETITQAPGEVGSYLNWLLYCSFPTEPRQANKLMLQAASEIDAALRDGRLPSRSAHFPIDPNWRLWGKQLLPSLKTVYREARSLKPWTNSPATSASTWYEMVFDEAASRRRISTSSQLSLGQGSISAPTNALDSVVLTDAQGKFLSACPLVYDAKNQTLTFHFRVSWLEVPQSYGLEFFQQGHRRFVHLVNFDPAHPWLAEQKSIPGVIADTQDKINLTYQFVLAGSGAKVLRFQAWQEHASSAAKAVFRVTLVLLFLAILFGPTWEPGRWSYVFAGLLLVLGWFVARIGFYTSIRAMLGWDTERYMRCISPGFILLLALAIACIAALLRSQWHNLSNKKRVSFPIEESTSSPGK